LNPKVAKCLDVDYSAWHGVLLKYRTSQIHLESFPGAEAQLREQFAVVEEISAEDLGDREDKMTMRYCIDHFLAEPLTKIHHSLLVARRTEVTALTRESQEILMATFA